MLQTNNKDKCFYQESVQRGPLSWPMLNSQIHVVSNWAAASLIAPFCVIFIGWLLNSKIAAYHGLSVWQEVGRQPARWRGRGEAGCNTLSWMISLSCMARRISQSPLSTFCITQYMSHSNWLLSLTPNCTLHFQMLFTAFSTGVLIMNRNG